MEQWRHQKKSKMLCTFPSLAQRWTYLCAYMCQQTTSLGLLPIFQGRRKSSFLFLFLLLVFFAALGAATLSSYTLNHVFCFSLLSKKSFYLFLSFFAPPSSLLSLAPVFYFFLFFTTNHNLFFSCSLVCETRKTFLKLFINK